MADFTALKTAIQNAIKQNGNEEITGNLLQEVLLAIVTTLGDGSINDLVTALGSEATTRTQADDTLQQNINAEAQARQQGDSTLQGGINTAMQAINAINNAIGNGCVYAGIATPSTTPAAGKVFYLALTAGTYTNFNGLEVSQGINILKNNGSTWSLDSFVGIDDAPAPSSQKLVKSGGVFDEVMKNGSAFDLSAYNGGATYADLNAALTALNALPAAYKRGGMSMKFVLSSDNKYLQYRCKTQSFSVYEDDWEIDVSIKDVVSIEKETLGLKINLDDCNTGVYYAYDSGARATSIHVRHSDIIPVNTGDVFDYVLYGYGLYYIIAAFDTSGTIVTSASVRGDTISSERRYVVPEGVKYIQFFDDADQVDTDYVHFTGKLKTLSDYVDNTINGKIVQMENCAGGMYYLVNGTLNNSTNIRHTDVFPVKKGDVFEYRLLGSNIHFIIVAFDATMQPVVASSVSTAIVKTGKYIVPDGVSYMQFFDDVSATDDYVKCIGIDETVENNHLESIEYDAIDGYYEDFNSYKKGYGYYADGTKLNSNNIYHSSIIPVVEGQKVNYKTVASNTWLVLAAFDANKEIVLSACVQGNSTAYQQGVYTVPSGVSFVQLFVPDTSFPLSFVFAHPQKPSFIPKTSRNTNVFLGYRDFGMQNSRQSLTQSEYSETVKQIITPYGYNIAQMKYEVAFEPTSDNCFIGIGTYMNPQHTVELRVNDNTFSIRVDGSWVGGSSKVAFTDTLPFSITSGNKYTMSIRTFDNAGNDKECSVVFSVTDGTDTYTKKVLRTYTEVYDNGVYGENIAGNVTGQLYVSLKQGSADIININVSSDYNPRVKVAIAGDSFVEGNTLVAGFNPTQLDKRYCSLIQDVIGVDNMLIDYLPGGRADSGWFSRVVNICRDFQPDYFILAMGTNNTVYDAYQNIYTVLLDILEYYGVKPVLVTVTPWSGNADAQPLENSFVRNSGYRYVDVCKAVTVRGNEREWKSGYVFNDGVHPSVAGHQAIYEAFIKEMPELFN